MLQDVALPDGTRIPLTGPAAKLSRTPTQIRHAAPALGADSEAILSELGIEAAEQRRLADAGVVDLANSPRSPSEAD